MIGSEGDASGSLLIGNGVALYQSPYRGLALLRRAPSSR